MDIYKILGFSAFVLVAAPFGIGIASTIKAPEPPPVVVEVVPAKLVKTYVVYKMPITTSFPQFSRTLSMTVAFMVDDGTEARNTLNDLATRQDERLDAVLNQAIDEAADAVSDYNDLRDVIPDSMRRALNVHLGTDADPAPVYEVLVTSYAIQ